MVEFKEIFFGEYHYTVDEKNRVFIPSRLRERLNRYGKFLILLRGLDRCILIYPESIWEDLSQKIQELPLTSREARQFSRYIFSGTYQCEMDSQGRVSLPGPLKEYAGIDKEVVIIGAGNRVEIWGKEEWDEHFREMGDKIDDIASRLEDYGI